MPFLDNISFNPYNSGKIMLYFIQMNVCLFKILNNNVSDNHCQLIDLVWFNNTVPLRMALGY